MSDSGRNPDNYCYRHPDRESYVVCQRCGRTICPECQTQAAVGVHCPECVKEARQSQPRSARTGPSFLRRFRGAADAGRPVVTYAIMALCIVIWLLELVPVIGDVIYSQGAYAPGAPYNYTTSKPWTMLTSAFLHSPGSIFHILFNMYSLFIFGPMVEHLLGRGRYIALYLIAAFAGSVGVLALSPGSIVVGASGAIFGLLGAYFVIARKLGGNTMQLVIVIGLNLAIGFFVPNIAWQAHLGGLIGGAAVAAVYLATRNRSQKKIQVAGVTGIAVALLGITAFAVTM